MSYDNFVQNRKVRKQFLLTEKDATKLKAVSDITGYSQNEIVNKALNAYLSRYKSKLSSIYGEMVN